MFELKASAQFNYYYSGIVCLGLLFINISVSLYLVKLIGTVLVFLLGYIIYNRLEVNLNTIKLKRLDKNIWLLEMNPDETYIGELQGDSISNQLFSILILKIQNSKITKKVVIFRDMLPKVQYHRLLLQIRNLL